MNSPTKQTRVAIVTGGSRGIGRAIAVALAQQGWNVSISYLHNSAAAQETASMVTQAGMRALTVKADVASYADTR